MIGDLLAVIPMIETRTLDDENMDEHIL